MQKVNGLPTMVMYPAKNYEFKVSEDMHKVSYSIKEDEGIKTKTMYTEGDSVVISLPDITNGLIADKTYPGLKEDELFAPVIIEIKEGKVDVIGRVITIDNGEE